MLDIQIINLDNGKYRLHARHIKEDTKEVLAEVTQDYDTLEIAEEARAYLIVNLL